MKTLYTGLVIASAIFMGATQPASASLNSGAKILVHLQNHVTKNPCGTLAIASCRDAAVTGLVGNTYDALICVGNQSDSVGVQGVQFGIDYNGSSGVGIDVFQWTNCGDLEFPFDGWPNAHSSNLVTWKDTNCKKQLAVVGVLYLAVYTPDRLSIIPRPADGQAKVASCGDFPVEEDLTNNNPSALGYADFGTGAGYNPCQNIVPVKNTTWGDVKSLFRK